jgi:hypothetical protein
MLAPDALETYCMTAIPFNPSAYCFIFISQVPLHLTPSAMTCHRKREVTGGANGVVVGRQTFLSIRERKGCGTVNAR